MELHKTISELTGIEGVTISGGEPLEQIDPLNELLKNIRQRTELSILLFSGFTLPEIKAMPTGENLLSRTDILISGRYQQNHPSDLPWIASGNQKVHFLTDRYTLVDLEPIPDSEILIGAGGELEITGINSFRMESQF
jgi:anaerobic ribonucleoside-triphosphate reductase activating protein